MKNSSYRFFFSAAIVTTAILLITIWQGSGENQILRKIGAVLLISTPVIWILTVVAFKKFGRVQQGKAYYESDVLVTSGIFGFLRHPQYFAYIILTIGFTQINQTLISVVLSIIAIILFYLHCIEEEKIMTEKFPIDYPLYCKQIPRFNIIVSLYKK